MLKIEISTSEHSTLMDLHQTHVHHVIRQRAHVILLRAEKLLNSQISRITGLSEGTIIEYVHQYLSNGLEWVKALNFRKPVSRLQPFDDVITEHFSKNPVSTIAQACKEIEILTGADRKSVV